MRNPDRLKPIYDHIKGIHKEHFPNTEFGPFIKKILTNRRSQAQTL